MQRMLKSRSGSVPEKISDDEKYILEDDMLRKSFPFTASVWKTAWRTYLRSTTTQSGLSWDILFHWGTRFQTEQLHSVCLLADNQCITTPGYYPDHWIWWCFTGCAENVISKRYSRPCMIDCVIAQNVLLWDEMAEFRSKHNQSLNSCVDLLHFKWGIRSTNSREAFQKNNYGPDQVWGMWAPVQGVWMQIGIKDNTEGIFIFL